MRKIYLLSCFFILVILLSCNNEKGKINNPNKGNLTSTYKLTLVNEKKMLLDEETGIKPVYLQYYQDSKGKSVLSFLNKNKRRIYFYDYLSSKFEKSLSFDSKEFKKYPSIEGYYISGKRDSIYLFDNIKQKLLITDKNLSILDSVSLIGNLDEFFFEWTYQYPQYFANAASPFLENGDELIFTGSYPWAIPDSILKSFNITVKININSNKMQYINLYPQTVYGVIYNWDDPMFTTAYSDLGHQADKLILSFPISHDLYISDLKLGEMKPIYGGSNMAHEITSMGKRISGDKNSRQKLNDNVINNDLYGGIKYDKYRKVYYRFIRRAIRNDQFEKNWENKELGIIIFDQNFKYLGETNIGQLKEWNWENSFVTKEGLNIEYIDYKTNDESNLRFKIFIPQEI